MLPRFGKTSFNFSIDGAALPFFLFTLPAGAADALDRDRLQFPGGQEHQGMACRSWESALTGSG